MAMCKYSVFKKIALLRRWRKPKYTCKINATGSGDSESELLLINYDGNLSISSKTEGKFKCEM